eukprot:g8083.t1
MRGVATLAKRPSRSRPMEGGGMRARWHHGVSMTIAAEGGAAAGGDQPRSGRTRISVEERDDVNLGASTTAAATAAATASARDHGSTRDHGSAGGGGGGDGVAYLNGGKGGLETDSGGIDGGGGVRGGGGDGTGGGEGQGARGGDGEGEGDGDEADELEIVAKGRRRARIVRKVEVAVKRGKIPKSSSKAYAKLLNSRLMSLLCKNSAWRARLLGDSTFMTKLAIEMVTGTVAQFLAEYQKRGRRFMEELDFVFADTLTCLFANFAAVWLSCPTVTVKAVCKKEAAKAGGALQKFLASCPSNAFQKVAVEGGVPKSFSVAQRAGALLLPMPKLFVIGFGATVAGYGLIAALESITAMRNQAQLAAVGGGGGGGGGGRSAKEKRAITRKSKKAQARALAEEKPPVPVFGSGLAVGVFLAVWTNFRYQFIAGAVEQRVFDTLLANQPGLSSLGSTAVRSANLYIGSLTIVDWLRYVGLQH